MNKFKGESKKGKFFCIEEEISIDTLEELNDNYSYLPNYYHNTVAFSAYPE